MNNKKNVLLIVLAVGVVAMTVAFAALSTTLNISGTASVPSTNWNIHFANWALDTASTVTVGSNTQQNTAVYPSIQQLQMSLAPNVTLVEGLNITLYQPNDYAKYTFNIVNDGTIDASLDNFTHTMTCESGKNCDFLEYTVECKDSQLNTVTNNYVLPHGQSVSCFLQLKFKDVDMVSQNTNNTNNLQASIVNGVYTQEATSATLSASWQWIQRKESQAQGGNSGNEPVTPTNSYETTFDGTYGYDYDGAETLGNGGSSAWVSTLDPNVEIYLRNDETKNEVCGVFKNGTVCLTGGDYESDFEDVTESAYYISTIAGLQETGLKGYTLAKVEEMLNKGASECNINHYWGGNYEVTCNEHFGTCSIFDDGSVQCGSLWVDSDGSALGHSAPQYE